MPKNFSGADPSIYLYFYLLVTWKGKIMVQLSGPFAFKYFGLYSLVDFYTLVKLSQKTFVCV